MLEFEVETSWLFLRLGLNVILGLGWGGIRLHDLRADP